MYLYSLNFIYIKTKGFKVKKDIKGAENKKWIKKNGKILKILNH